MAAPFDTKTLQITGDAINITEQWMVTDETIPNLSFSAKGTLVYVPHEGRQEQNRDLVWVDLYGQEEPLEVPPKEYESVRMSSDIAHPQIVAEVDGCIWIYNTSGASPIRPLTLDSEGVCISPVWIPPDNHEIVFYSRDSNNLQIKRKAVDRTGEAEVISAKSSKWFWFAPFTCTPDGKVLLAAALRSEKAPAIWDRLKIRLDREGEVEQLLELKNSARYLALSPDGKWLAYVCEEQDRNEVFVTSWPDLKRNWLISTETEGGKEPVWAPDSKTIYYRNGTKLVAVKSVTEGGFTPGRAQYLFDDVYQPGFLTWSYDIHPDGKRFLMIKKVEEQEKAPIIELIIVDNWFEELKRRVPTGEN
jgi:dipeptidyl aminopeptidase/acylaminoacyl peptidase